VVSEILPESPSKDAKSQVPMFSRDSTGAHAVATVAANDLTTNDPCTCLSVSFSVISNSITPSVSSVNL